MLREEVNPCKELTIEYIITRQFTNSEEFSIFIETEAKRRHITNYEMIIEYCDERAIEPVSVAPLISSRLKQLVQVEAENLNLMKKKTNKLPL